MSGFYLTKTSHTYSFKPDASLTSACCQHEQHWLYIFWCDAATLDKFRNHLKHQIRFHMFHMDHDNHKDFNELWNVESIKISFQLLERVGLGRHLIPKTEKSLIVVSQVGISIEFVVLAHTAVIIAQISRSRSERHAFEVENDC